ncbi:hypothetical protein, partial [Oharaeibacter diazotrophicus]
MAAPLVANPAVDVVPTPDGEALAISARSAVRGFLRTVLDPGAPGYGAATAAAAGRPADSAGLPADDVAALWAAGLLV